MSRRLKVLLIAPYYSQATPGESWSTYKWVEGISRDCQTTVLTTHHAGWNPSQSPVSAHDVVNWCDLSMPKRLARISHELKPGYVLFYWRARRWIKRRIQAGWDFDLIHQLNPLALRYPSPAAGLGLRYIVGPLAGSLETPDGFAAEAVDRQFFRKLRNLDRFRIRHDPLLRRTYTDAALVLGVAPYVRDVLSALSLKRFEVLSETGVESVATLPKNPPEEGQPLRLLFVGRIIRTKGILDAIRAVALAAKKHRLQFDVVGEGDLLPTCRAEALRLGISELVHFHGRLPRAALGAWYDQAHVFLFPSFREPSGNVVFEAMSYGCPVIASTCGGPGFVVNDSCGVRVPPGTPSEYANSLGQAIESLAGDRERLKCASVNALSRILDLAYWPLKLRRLGRMYAEVAGILDESPGGIEGVESTGIQQVTDP